MTRSGWFLWALTAWLASCGGDEVSGSASAPGTECGNGLCDGDESCASCEADCGPCESQSCGDGVCDDEESCVSCEADCDPCEDPCTGLCLYVRPSGESYGAGDGSSYHDAWSGFEAIDWAMLDDGDGTLFICGEHRETLTVGASGEEGAFLELRSCTTALGATVDDPAILNQTEALEPSDFTLVGGGLYRAEMSVPLTFGPIRNGERLPYWSSVPVHDEADLQANLPDNTFYSRGNRWNPCGAETTAYLRRDDGDIGTVEVGARPYAFDSAGEDYIRLVGLRFYGGSGSDKPAPCYDDPQADVDAVGWGANVLVASDSDYIEIVDCQHGPGSRAGNVGSYVTHVTLDGVTIRDMHFGYYFHGDRSIYGQPAGDPPVPTPTTSCIQTVAHVLVQNMTCTDIGRVPSDGGDLECLGFNTTRDITVRDSYFARNGRSFPEASHSSLVSGVVNCNFRVERNYFYDGGGGMTHNSRDTGTIIAYNVFDGWGRIDSAKTHADTAVWLGGSGGDWMGETTVSNNLFIHGPGETQDDLQASLQILFENFDLLTVKNNVFHDNAGLADILYNPTFGSTVEIEGNLVFRSAPTTNVVRWRAGASSTWYQYDSATEPDLADLVATEAAFVDMRIGDPLLGDTAEGPEHGKVPSDGSPCIDAGIDLGSGLALGLASSSTFAPLDVATADQNLHGAGWEIGPYVHTAR